MLPLMLETGVGDKAVKVEPSTNYTWFFFAFNNSQGKQYVI